MRIKQMLANMSNEELELFTDKFCDAIHKACEDWYNNLPEDEPATHPEGCDVCPFANLCSYGKSGVVEYLNSEATDVE